MTAPKKVFNSKYIYSERDDTLANRIDLAWDFYTNSENTETEKKIALEFLIYALDIEDPNDVNNQLFTLMEERNKHKLKNPEYIPGKAPKNLPLKQNELILEKIPSKGKPNNSDIAKALNDKELLDVNIKDKEFDRVSRTKFLTPLERAKYRVLIKNGVFKKNNQNFATSEMISHNKKGFASFTLNANGELSVFSHTKGDDQIYHSSMNSGSPVVAAGELKIKDGKLIAISTYSGHYNPTLFNVYRLLEYFTQHQVDISNVKVITGTNPSVILKGVTSHPIKIKDKESSYELYETPASQIFIDMNKIINDNISSINKQVKTYKERGLVSTLFTIKDFITGSDLTKKRTELAELFENNLNDFKKSMGKGLTLNELSQKIKELDGLVADCQKSNNDLSIKYDKEINTGRLATQMTLFKSHISEIQKSNEQNDSTSKNNKLKNNH